MDRKNDLIKSVNEFLNDASPEGLDVIEALVKATKEKEEGKYRSYLSALMQVESRFLENGDYEVRIPIQPVIHNPLQIVHGGITASLIDTAMGSFVNQSLPDHLVAVTTELKINYLKPGLGKELICIASIVHKGSSVYVCEAKVYNEENTFIAMGTGSFFIIKRQKAKPSLG